MYNTWGGVNLPGNDLSTGSVTGGSGCRDLCSAQASCAAAVFNPLTLSCTLKKVFDISSAVAANDTTAYLGASWGYCLAAAAAACLACSSRRAR